MVHQITASNYVADNMSISPPYEVNTNAEAAFYSFNLSLQSVSQAFMNVMAHIIHEKDESHALYWLYTTANQNFSALQNLKFAMGEVRSVYPNYFPVIQQRVFHVMYNVNERVSLTLTQADDAKKQTLNISKFFLETQNLFPHERERIQSNFLTSIDVYRRFVYLCPSFADYLNQLAPHLT